MKKFMFYTADGYTQDINGKDIENCQILGWGNGVNLNEAHQNFLAEQDYLNEFDFETITAVKVLEETIIK